MSTSPLLAALGAALLMSASACDQTTTTSNTTASSTGAAEPRQPEAVATGSEAAPSKAARSRIEELLDVPSATPPEGGVLPFGPGAELRYPKGFHAQGGDDLTSALDTLTAAEQSVHCYMTARLLGSGDPLAGVKLWAQSAGGRPESFSGPEPIVLGPEKAPAKLYHGKDGVRLGNPGGKGEGITIAIVPDGNPKLLIVGVARQSASPDLKAKLAGCLQSFRLK